MAEELPESGYDLAPPDKKAAEKTPVTRTLLRTEMGPERACQFCGFTFRGPPKARCPECSAPMDSSEVDLLKFADPSWVRTVARGALLLAVAIAGHLAAIAQLTLARIWWTSVPASQPIVHAAAAALLLAAIWLATRREPDIQKPASPLILCARIAALAALVIWGVLGLERLAGLEWSHGTIRYVVMLALICHGTLAALLGHYFGGLAARIPDDSLARHSINSGGAAALACALLLVIQWLELTTSVHVMFFTCSFPLVAGVFAIFIWAGVTLLRLALDMRASADAGETIRAKRAQRIADRGS